MTRGHPPVATAHLNGSPAATLADMVDPGEARRPLRVVFLNWRDTSNPEGGGSEVYVETIAEGLARRGHVVTIGCAEHVRGDRVEVRSGVTLRRQGTKWSVYPKAARSLRRGDFGAVDVVVDVQNGIPFCTPLASRAPVVVLVHHVHREQWPVIYGPVRSRIGWWIESRFAPRVYRSASYVAVSERTRSELAGLGIAPERIEVIHNGTTIPSAASTPPSPTPLVLALGRLVPHKRVEHAIDEVARLRPRLPGIRLAIVGDGWWRPELDAHVERLGVSDIVDFHGHVDEESKDRLLRQAWVLALPSLKEGWGLVVMEAAARGTPTVAYADAGGVAESIVHGRTGLLATDRASYADNLEAVLSDATLRERLGARARAYSESFDWERSVAAFEAHLERRVGQSRAGHAAPAPERLVGSVDQLLP